MAVGPDSFPEMNPIPGVRLGSASAGIKTPGRRDLVVMELVSGSRVASVFTQNAFCAAPVIVAREHLASSDCRWFLINTGNANAGTGAQGIEDAKSCCRALASAVNDDSLAVLPFSTGVIGEQLPVNKVISTIPLALENLAEDGWRHAAEGILTTDTRPKGATRCFEHQGRILHVSGIAKGSGMICPNMATMLAYIATDALVSQTVLQKLLDDAVAQSFNRISVDGDTSTNDACMLVASGRADNAELKEPSDPLFAALSTAITEVAIELAQAIVKDGEGASKFITVAVEGGASEQECLQVAYSLAHSPLVKTAMFASDPNWGRILAVVGRAGLDHLDVSGVDIYLGDVCIVSAGALAADYTESAGQAVMNLPEITVRINLGRGVHSSRLWTTDLSHDYVSINADYRS